MEREISFGPLDIETELPQTLPIEVDAGTDIETVDGGRLVRTRRALHARLAITAERDDGLVRLTMTVRNTAAPAGDKDEAIAVSLIGTHLVAEVIDGDFVSLLEPPDVGRRRRRPMPPTPLLPGAGRTTRRPCPVLVVADHPLRPSRDRRAERGSPVRLDRDRRDPHAAGHDDDRRGEGGRHGPPTRWPRRSSTAATRCPRRRCCNLHGVLRNPHALSGGRRD